MVAHRATVLLCHPRSYFYYKGVDYVIGYHSLILDKLYRLRMDAYKTPDIDLPEHNKNNINQG